MRHLTTPEAKGQLYLVALLEELEDLAHLHLIIMVVDVRTHLDLFDLLRLLALALLVGLLLGLIFDTTDVEEFCNWRIGARADLDQVEAYFLRLFKGFPRIHYAQIFAIFVDHPDFLATG